MFTNVGVAASAGVAAALLIGVGIFPIIVVQFMGKNWRPSKPGDSVGRVRDQEQGVNVEETKA